MNEKRRPWTSAEKATLFAAVEQWRATGRQLDWHAIAATVPGRSAKAAQALYYQLFAAHTLVRIRAPAAPVSPPPSVFRRPCLRCRRPLNLGSKAELDLQFVQGRDRCAWVDRRLIHTPPRPRLVRGAANLRMSECHNPVTRRARPTPAGPSGDNEPWRALGPWSDASSSVSLTG